jgi:hypothetical protein
MAAASQTKHRTTTTTTTTTAGATPYLFVILVLVAATSFFHSVHVLSTTEPHALQASLEDFKKGPSTRQKSSGSSTSKTPRNEPVDMLPNSHEAPIPNPVLASEANTNTNTNGTASSSSSSSTFSACLLVMDDNHRLVEWMAYHYHVLPLRYLIIAVDPRSRTSPTALLNRWRRMGVHVEEWDDFHFLRHDIARNVVPDDADLHIKRDRHRIRQKNFYRQCLMHLKQANRTFTTLIDTDEFLTYNHKGGNHFEAWERQQQDKHERSKYADKTRIRPAHIPPTTAQAGGLIEYIHHERAAGMAFYQRPCLSIPRLQFGAKESTKDQRAKQVPTTSSASTGSSTSSSTSSNTIIDPDRFDTLRFRKHAERQDFVANGLSKSIVDVSRIPDDFPRIQSLHRPIKTLCSAPWKDEWSSGLRINHYLGSWEAYSFRDDSRRGGERSVEGWAFKAQDADETDDNIRPWMGGFVAQQGAARAHELLQGAGLPRGYHDPSGKNWTILFLDEILGVNETQGNENRVAFDNFVRDFHFKKTNPSTT